MPVRGTLEVRASCQGTTNNEVLLNRLRLNFSLSWIMSEYITLFHFILSRMKIIKLLAIYIFFFEYFRKCTSITFPPHPTHTPQHTHAQTHTRSKGQQLSDSRNTFKDEGAAYIWRDENNHFKYMQLKSNAAIKMPPIIKLPVNSLNDWAID